MGEDFPCRRTTIWRWPTAPVVTSFPRYTCCHSNKFSKFVSRHWGLVYKTWKLTKKNIDNDWVLDHLIQRHTGNHLYKVGPIRSLFKWSYKRPLERAKNTCPYKWSYNPTYNWWRGPPYMFYYGFIIPSLDTIPQFSSWLDPPEDGAYLEDHTIYEWFITMASK